MNLTEEGENFDLTESFRSSEPSEVSNTNITINKNEIILKSLM